MENQNPSNLYSAINPGMKTMFHNKNEEDFLFGLCKPHMTVLEWGSGLSTLAIAPLVKSVVSIESHFKWAVEMKAKIPKNVDLHYIEPNNPDYQDDGTYEDFKDYIEFPKTLGTKFDLIFIDGRARMECAKLSPELLAPNGVIVIHDIFHPDHKWKRYEYDIALQWLEHTGGIFTMHSFIPKPKTEEPKQEEDGEEN